MGASSWFVNDRENDAPEVLWEDGERVYWRIKREGTGAARREFIAVLSSLEHPTHGCIDRLTREFELKDYLDDAWALRPLEFVRDRGRTMLLLEHYDGKPLHRLNPRRMEIEEFLRFAVASSSSLGRLHERGLLHKDIKPANIFVESATGHVRFTGFGFASRLRRQRLSPEAPEFISGTLAYMAPEQTGRINRSIDSRSDLYSFGVTLYQTLTGGLPFTASEPMEWIHCHIARKPDPPAVRFEDVPEPVSAIVMKLLSKTPEERYQTAAGVERDLRRCLTEWSRHGRIENFVLGEHDVPDRLIIPEKLYGRKAEIDILLSAFGRVAAGDGPELVLVSGYAGIGKSSIVNELHKVLVPPCGLFASGKFDQYRRDIPYATLAQAFQALVRQLLNKSDAELALWRNSLMAALGPNGQLIVNMIPDLALVIGEQPPLPHFDPHAAQARFHFVFRSFVGVFARPEHPLTLFIDDLQWLDTATLDLMRYLVMSPDMHHLMVVGAYRDNEVDSTHPLSQTLAEIRGEGGTVSEIVLAPLLTDHVAQFAADALHTTTEKVGPLGDLLFEKAGGNPFFTIQFISELAEENLLSFNAQLSSWQWDLGRIKARQISDNLADLMATKLNRLPSNVRDALGQLACIGNAADLATVARVSASTEQEVEATLHDSLEAGLIAYAGKAIAFSHDRVHEAAYAMIPQPERAAKHLRIGRSLLSQAPSVGLEGMIFQIVDQFERGRSEIDSLEERVKIAELNLIAGKRAMAASAYESARRYLVSGRSLMGKDSWEDQYRLTFDLERHLTECEFVARAFTAAEERLGTLSKYAANLPDHAAAAGLGVLLYLTTSRPERGVDLALEFLRRAGIDWSVHPSEEVIQHEAEQMTANLAHRSMEALIDLPAMIDPDSVATLEVLGQLLTASGIVSRSLSELCVLRMVNLSLEHGHSDASCAAYSVLGVLVRPHLIESRTVFVLGQLACDLLERYGRGHPSESRIYVHFAYFVMPWFKHVRESQPLLRRSFEVSASLGDDFYAAYAYRCLVTTLLVSGMPLDDVQREAERAIAFVESVRLGLPAEHLVRQRRLASVLRGIESDHQDSDEEWARQDPEGQNALANMIGCHWVFKLQDRFFAGDYAAAIEASEFAKTVRSSMQFCLEEAEYEFYSALTRAALCEGASETQRVLHLAVIREHYAWIKARAEHCPENFENRAGLVGAELARLENRTLDAEDLYEVAIHSAQANGFIHNEALANELAARFYRGRGLEKVSKAYLKDARYLYLRWGAEAKVRQLDELLPALPEEHNGQTHADATSLEHLDLATVLKVSHAVLRDMDLESLLNILMRTAIEYAGAERGLLVDPRGGALRLEAEATTNGTTINVELKTELPQEDLLPEAILHYVVHTQETVIVDDAQVQGTFHSDPYIRQHLARSILCLPLVNQGKLIRVLYLENNLASHAFTPDRISILKLLASLASISLENTRLYEDLKGREAKIRRLVDSNIIGICIGNIEGEFIEVNDAFLKIVGYDRDTFMSAPIRWVDLSPPEWNERDDRARAQLRTTYTAGAYERELLKRDGTRVPVLIGGALFEHNGNEGVAFVLDLSDQKQTEDSLAKARSELAHVSRAMSLGAMSASIAHEINQPLSGITMNASTCLRRLAADPPNVDGAAEIAQRVIRDANRASEIISRLRALFSKKDTVAELVDLNGAVRGLVALSLSDFQANRVTLRTDFDDDLPLVTGDPVQLQQVILNLLRNANDAMRNFDDRPKHLLIKTETEGDGRVRLSVKDSGIGISQDGMDKLFSAFYTTKSDGMGMGLSLSRSIIESHNGHLWATPNDGPGVTFSFSLPAAPKA